MKRVLLVLSITCAVTNAIASMDNGKIKENFFESFEQIMGRPFNPEMPLKGQMFQFAKKLENSPITQEQKAELAKNKEDIKDWKFPENTTYKEIDKKLEFLSKKVKYLEKKIKNYEESWGIFIYFSSVLRFFSKQSAL